jgi:hypothetical protein
MLALRNGDLQAYISLPDGSLGWRSLSQSSPLAIDVKTLPTVLNEYYQVSTCGQAGDAVTNSKRSIACALLESSTELRGLRDIQAIPDFQSATTIAQQKYVDAVNPLYPLGAMAFVDPVSKSVVTSFGVVATSFTTYRKTIVFRGTTPNDYSMSGDFVAYTVPSFDPPSASMYLTFDTKTGIAVSAREFWISNLGWQSNPAPTLDALHPGAIYISYACPTTTASQTCSTAAFIANNSPLLVAPFPPTQPVATATAPPGYSEPNADLRHPQLVVDAKGTFHIFWIAVLGGKDKLYYAHCPVTHGTDASGFKFDNSKCTAQKIVEITTPAAPGSRLQVRFFNGTEENGQTIVVGMFGTDNRRDTATSSLAVYLYSFTPQSDAGLPWVYTSTQFPPLQSPIHDNLGTQFIFPLYGRIYDFHLAITDDLEKTPAALTIAYSYTRYTNAYSNKKRATPGSPDRSREEYVFRAIICPEFRCLSFTTRQLIGSRSFFQDNYGTVPTGIVGLISSTYNNGFPSYSFSVGSGDTQHTVRINSLKVPTLPGYDVSGGDIAVLNCADATCASGSMQRASDYLAGHRGEFAYAPTPTGVIIASIPVVAGRRSPVWQSYKNQNLAPTSVSCSATQTGQQRSIDGEVYVCTALPDSPILDATSVFYWAPVAPSLHVMSAVAPVNQANTLTGLFGSLPTC